jgi:hypothetical protein
MLDRFSYAAILVVGWAIGSACAAGITFSDRAAFEAAIASPRRYSFDPANGFATAPAPISSVDGGFLQFSSNGGPASLDTFGAVGNQALTGRANSQVNRSAIVTITPAGHQNAIGFDILDLGSSTAEAATIVINDNTDRPVVPYQVQDNDGNPATSVFFGVIWDVDMTGVDVWAENLACVGLGPCYTPNFIDNVTVAVPEPGVVWVGMIGLWMMARRGRRIL